MRPESDGVSFFAADPTFASPDSTYGTQKDWICQLKSTMASAIAAHVSQTDVLMLVEAARDWQSAEWVWP